MVETAMTERRERTIALLEAQERAAGWPSDAPVSVVRAPGRVNLIGEHTDYNEGLVLPAAIEREAWIAFRPTDEPRVELASAQMGTAAAFAFDALAPRAGRAGDWIDYVAGTAWAMREAGLPIRGFRGVLDSDVPVGAGLSSSAAIELAASWALGAPEAPRPVPPRMAAICQRAENAYVGVNSGIMDQFASAAGIAGSAILLDCRSLVATPAPLPPDLAVVVCDTGSPHRLDASAYNERRAECEEGVRIIAAHEPGVRALRDVDEAMLTRYRHLLPERVAMRCEHVVREDERVGLAVIALAAGDLDEIGRLFAASHASLRDLYEVSSPELDLMVGIATAVPGVVAARMTGAGFGGCTVNLVRPEAIEPLQSAVVERYPAATGLRPAVYATRAVDGAGVVREA
ncbi:MAG TPA: galactokinase [Candidatus Dormibacteraeota bacterium]|nr:galactokinase [Candidatus Dormibacteraeota bacterium]